MARSLYAAVSPRWNEKVFVAIIVAETASQASSLYFGLAGEGPARLELLDDDAYQGISHAGGWTSAPCRSWADTSPVGVLSSWKQKDPLLMSRKEGAS